MAVLWAVVHVRPLFACRRFASITDCSAFLGLSRSRDFDPKRSRWALRLPESEIAMKWRAGTSHQLPDAVSRLLRLRVTGDSIGDAFPNDASSSNLPMTSPTAARV